MTTPLWQSGDGSSADQLITEFLAGLNEYNEKFIARKLSQIDGAKTWTVAPPFASLNSITIDINPADKASLLYSTDFQTEVISKLPDGTQLHKAGNGRK